MVRGAVIGAGSRVRGLSVCSDGPTAYQPDPEVARERHRCPGAAPVGPRPSGTTRACHVRPAPDITNVPLLGGHRSSATRPAGPDAFLGESTNLRLVRLRLFLALVTMFAIPIVIAAPFIYGLTSGMGTPLVVPTVAILTLAIVLGALTVWLARRVLEPAERLEQTRRHPRGRLRPRPRRSAARHAHRPRQPPRVPGGDRAAVVDRDAARGRSMALAIIDLDDFKRINDSSGHAAGDLVAPPGRDDDRHVRPPRRPGVPRRRRRVRARDARHRRRAGASDHPPAAGGLPRRRDRPRGGPHGLVLGRHQRGARAARATARRSTARPTRRSTGASATAGPA